MKWLREHSLSIALVVLFLALLVAGYVLPESYKEHADNAFGMAHDTFGAFLIVSFTKFLRERGKRPSKESK